MPKGFFKCHSCGQMVPLEHISTSVTYYGIKHPVCKNKSKEEVKAINKKSQELYNKDLACAKRMGLKGNDLEEYMWNRYFGNDNWR